MDNNSQDRLTMLDEKGSRVFIIPAEVKGFFRKHRDWTQFVLIAIFLILPWITINGAPAILLDFPHRRFALFGVSFFAHDAPNLFFIFVILALSLAFVTAIWGRIWCGWACPQTVFIDGVYRRIETWIEGNYIERRKLRDGPWNFNKISKLTIKWFGFFAVSSIIAHCFAAYFIGAEDLMAMVQGAPNDHWSYFVTISVITALLMLDFGWFREQFCIIACPYGRFQSVLMDQNSLAVVYDEQRGEPRKGGTLLDGQKQGDCVSCNRCVNVCPTGIDIRKGMQMECITCTACIDACDEIMEKVKKPKGLIRYDTLARVGTKVWRPRTLVYFAVIGLAAFGLTYRLSSRTSFHSLILRAKDAPYIMANNEKGEAITINHLRVHITNQTWNKASYRLFVDPSWVETGLEFTMPLNPILVEPGKNIEGHFFVKLPRSLTKGTGVYKSRILIQDTNRPTIAPESKELTLLGPAD
jgi:cytochrome c oxidase accessory protein FixG